MRDRHPFTKVPEITIFFWIVKLLTTALGESTSDFLVYAMNPYVAVGLGALGFIAAISLQFRARRYNAWIYWFAVTMVAVFGTMAADVVHIALGVPYLISTIVFAIVLAIVFAVWVATEHTLSIHSIYTTRREAFYWLTVVTTFALGTATGDLTATTFGLGYLVSGIFFGVVILFIAVLHYLTKDILRAEHQLQSRNAVLAFWLAYIFTRPLGASFADWFGKSPAIGGLGWGDGPVSFSLAVLIILFVAYLAYSRVDTRSAGR
jgi:uncharacterized membrane-anchored protein